MADIRMVREHYSGTLEQAKVRVHQVLADLRSSLDKHIDRVEWNDQETEAALSGRHVKGTFRFDEKNIILELNLSLMARLAKGLIEGRIDQIIRERLTPQAK